MTRGRFITLEGGEGAGKSTQARLLTQALADRGRAVLLTREPGGTPGAERIRALLLDPAFDWTAAAEALLFAAARADHVAHAIRPALDRGTWVVCDRFLDSSRAYQGGAGGMSDDDVMTLHRIGSGNLLPDLTLLIEAAPAVAAERLKQRDGIEQDRIGGRASEYHSGVGRSFAAMADKEPQRIQRIDGEGSADEVHGRIMSAVEKLLAAQ